METGMFSRQEIETIANRGFDCERMQVLNYRLERYSKDLIGFLGTHENLEITIKCNGNSETEILRFFVKSITSSLSEELLKYVLHHNLFDREATYFNDILPVLKSSCPDVEDWSPKCFLATDKFIVLEDMSLRKYAMTDTKILSEDQLKAAFKAQARLHAASLVVEKQLGKPLNEIYTKSCAEVYFSNSILISQQLELQADLAEKVAKRLGRDSRRLRVGFRKGLEQMYDQSQLSTKLPKVFLHGDAWPNNYLFDASDPPKCVLVDFQMTRYGPPMCDSILLTYLGTDREFRQKLIHKAIEAYCEQFCEVLENNDPEIEKPILEDFLEEYEELRATALFCAVMYCPIICMGKSTIDKYNQVERNKKLMFRQDNSFVMQIYDEDKLFAARINDVVEEAVEYFEQRGLAIQMNTSQL